MSSAPFWQKINKMRSNRSARKTSTLVKDNVVYGEDCEKATLFRNRMEGRHAGQTDPKFDKSHKAKVEEEVKSYMEKNKAPPSEEIALKELRDNISRLKTKSSAGIDGIHNCMLKHLPQNFLRYILKLCNMSIKLGKIPEAWKEARLTMIPKGKKSRSDPANYRPISLLSCLGKLLERIVAQRLQKFLESNKKLAKHQSGFRTGRRTSDNLVFFSQKVSEAFNRGKKYCLFTLTSRRRSMQSGTMALFIK